MCTTSSQQTTGIRISVWIENQRGEIPSFHSESCIVMGPSFLAIAPAGMRWLSSMHDAMSHNRDYSLYRVLWICPRRAIFIRM